MPGFCDGCSQPFDISHALDCKKGGLVSARHNESRDLNIELLKLTGLTQITKEPIVRESNSDGEGALRVDWGVRGFWDFQREALFDIRILNADAPSYLSNSLASIFDSACVEKRKKSTVQLQRIDGHLSLLSSALVKLYLTMKWWFI